MKKLTLERMAKIEGGRVSDKQCAVYLERFLATGYAGFADFYMKWC